MPSRAASQVGAACNPVFRGDIRPQARGYPEACLSLPAFHRASAPCGISWRAKRCRALWGPFRQRLVREAADGPTHGRDHAARNCRFAGLAVCGDAFAATATLRPYTSKDLELGGKLRRRIARRWPGLVDIVRRRFGEHALCHLTLIERAMAISSNTRRCGSLPKEALCPVEAVMLSLRDSPLRAEHSRQPGGLRGCGCLDGESGSGYRDCPKLAPRLVYPGYSSLRSETAKSGLARIWRLGTSTSELFCLRAQWGHKRALKPGEAAGHSCGRLASRVGKRMTGSLL